MKASIILAAIVLAVVISAGVFAALSANHMITFTGTIATINVEAYNDAGLTQLCTGLDIGTIAPGTSASQTIYIKNTGTVSETLTMVAANWVPTSASSVLTLSWDRQNFVLGAGQSTPAVFTLTAAADVGALTTFGCQITITGTG